MEQGPLPPHERTWRHPSEVAAEERALLTAEPAAPSTRTVALTTGTVGLVAVAALVFTVTPHRSESPVALSATSSPIATAVTIARSAPERSEARPIAASGLASIPSRPTLAPPVDAIATPIADGRYALITLAAATGAGRGELRVRLPSGRVGSATVIAVVGDATVVALGEAEPGPRLAHRRPDDDTIVTVMTNPPVTIAFGAIDTLEAMEGTPVIDGEGALVGLCGHDRSNGDLTVIDVTERSAGATSGDR